MNKCAECRYFEPSGDPSDGHQYGYCKVIASGDHKAEIQVDTKYQEFIEGIYFCVRDDFGCTLWEQI